jgi:hypothetical protein
MGFDWKAVKGLFVEAGDDSPAPEKKSKGEKVPVPQTAAPAAPVPTGIPVDVSAGKPDQSIIDNLVHALLEANLDGFDYFEFAKVVDSMAASIPAEQMRYQAAFATAAAMNANKAHLLKTADHYITILAGEADKFSVLVAEQTQVTVTDKENSITSIDAAINEKAAMITQLTNEINELSSSKTAILNETSENKIKIQKVQNDFAACLKVFLDKINGDKAKINQYIPN